MLFFNICLSSANLIHWVLFYLPFGYDSESITSFRVQCVIHLTNHLAEQTFFMGGFFICYSVRKCPEYYQQFLIYLISTRAFTTTSVLKNIQFLESLFWFYFNLAPHQSTRMKLCSCCQDNHCLFSGRGKKSKTCRMPVEFEPEGHSLWAHLVLPTRAGYSRKLRLQMSFHITTYNFFSGTGENAKGKFNMTVPLLKREEKFKMFFRMLQDKSLITHNNWLPVPQIDNKLPLPIFLHPYTKRWLNH